MNNQYIFFTGRFALLSYAELYSLYGNVFQGIDRQFGVLQLPQEFTKQDLYSLGGTIKVAVVEMVIDESQATEQNLADFIAHEILAARAEDNKFRYAVNVYGRTRLSLTKILNYSKKAAKKVDLSVRFVNKNMSKNISSVVVGKERLVEKGADINICVLNRKVYITRTVASQDFEEYSGRDYDKPVRDMEGGIMPPKLAQMMLNFALGKDRAGKTVYDPFCGSGTLVMEGMLQKLTMIGSDIYPEVVENAKQNCAWLLQEYAFRKPAEPTLFVHDAMKPFPIKEKVDAMVSESYLGPTLHELPGLKRIQEILDDVRRIHKGFFASAAEVLPSGASIVICFPFYPNNGRPIFVEKLLEKLQVLGYTTSDLLPEEIITALGFRKNTRNSLLYVRDDQIVGREIFKFVRS